MPHIEPEIETSARIKVVGVGGGGGNAINHMITSKVRGVEFVVMNSDVQDLHKSPAKKKIHLGKNLTRGLGAGMNPDLGKRAAEETKAEIQDTLKGADMVFIAAGMGGGTGTGASPVIAKVAREIGALTVAVVTKPFFFEGAQRTKIAEGGLSELKEEVDAMIVIPNDRLLNSVKKEVTLETAFSMSNEVLKQAVEGISDLINMPGVINLDFNDIKAVMSSTGSALMGIGLASGDKRAEVAARTAINSPLLDISINGARGVLFAIAGGPDMTLYEIHEAAKVITESIDKEAKIIFGSINDSRLGKGEVKVTVIATGFPQNVPSKPLFPQQSSSAENASPMKKEMKKEDFLGTLNPIKQSAALSQPETHIALSAPAASPTQTHIETIDLDDDPWETIPAFLRRPKGQK